MIYNTLNRANCLTHAEKLELEESAEHPKWKLTDPVPLDGDGSSVETVLGKNPDVHYVYICTKVGNKYVSS